MGDAHPTTYCFDSEGLQTERHGGGFGQETLTQQQWETLTQQQWETLTQQLETGTKRRVRSRVTDPLES